MRKILFIFSCLLFIINPVYGMNLEWEQQYTTVGTGNSSFLDVLTLTNGEYVAVGSNIVMQVDTQGNTVWSTPLSGTAWDIDRTGDGGFIVVGNSFTGASVDIMLVKLTSTGVISWTQYFDIDGDHFNEYGKSVQECENGGFILAGSVSSPTQDSDCYIIKTDSMGNQIWDNRIETPNAETAVKVLGSSDGYYIAGSSTAPAATTDFLLIKLKNNGLVDWVKTYGSTSNFESATDMLRTSGGYVISGGIGSTYTTYLVKVDLDGNIIWESTYSTLQSNPRAMVAYLGGGFVLPGHYSVSPTETRFSIVKTDSLGNDLLEESFTGMDLMIYIEAITPAMGGDYVLAGSAGDIPDRYPYLVKITHKDIIPPEVEITGTDFPMTRIPTLVVEGTATDNEGVAQVNLKLYRYFIGMFWPWKETEVHDINNGEWVGKFTIDGSISGLYKVTAQAVDINGNLSNIDTVICP